MSCIHSRYLPCHPQGQKFSSVAFNKNTQTHPHSSTLVTLTEKPFTLLRHPLFVSLSNWRRSLRESLASQRTQRRGKTVWKRESKDKEDQNSKRNAENKHEGAGGTVENLIASLVVYYLRRRRRSAFLVCFLFPWTPTPPPPNSLFNPLPFLFWIMAKLYIMFLCALQKYCGCKNGLCSGYLFLCVMEQLEYSP